MSVSAEDISSAFYDQLGLALQIVETILDPLAIIAVDEQTGAYFKIPVTLNGDSISFGDPVPQAHIWDDHPDPGSVPPPTEGVPGMSTPDDQGVPMAARAGVRHTRVPQAKAARWPQVIRQAAARPEPINPEYARVFPPDTAPAPGEDMIDYAARTGRIMSASAAGYRRQRDAAVRASADPAGTRAAIDASYLRLPPVVAAAGPPPQAPEDRFAGLFPPTAEALDERDKIDAAAEDREYDRRRAVQAQAVQAAAGDDQLARLFGPDWDQA